MDSKTKEFGGSADEPREGVEEPRALGVGEGDPHPGHERRVQDDRADLVPGSEVDRRHGADALSVQDDVLGADAVALPERVPRRVNVRVQILLGRSAAADAVPAVVVREDVAVDARAQPQVEAAHLAQVDGVAVREQDRELGVGLAAHEQARNLVAPGRAREEALDGVAVAVRVLPLGALRQLQGERKLVFGGGGGGVGAPGGQQRVRGLGRQERQLGRDARGTRRPAEEAAQLRQAQPVHGWPVLRTPRELGARSSVFRLSSSGEPTTTPNRPKTHSDRFPAGRNSLTFDQVKESRQLRNSIVRALSLAY